jgi:hypothetical protein
MQVPSRCTQITRSRCNVGGAPKVTCKGRNALGLVGFRYAAYRWQRGEVPTQRTRLPPKNSPPPATCRTSNINPWDFASSTIRVIAHAAASRNRDAIDDVPQMMNQKCKKLELLFVMSKQSMGCIDLQRSLGGSEGVRIRMIDATVLVKSKYRPVVILLIAFQGVEK